MVVVVVVVRSSDCSSDVVFVISSSRNRSCRCIVVVVVDVVVAEHNVFTIADRAAHGLMPVPPPATLYLMQNMVLTAGYIPCTYIFCMTSKLILPTLIHSNIFE